MIRPYGRRGSRGGATAPGPGPRLVPLLAAAAAGLGAVAWTSAADTMAAPKPAPEARAGAMPGTEHYCTGYARTFHGEWRFGDAAAAGGAGRPVPFRIGANAGGAGCYAQLNVVAPPGVAPYELRRFLAKAREGTVWSLRYRGIVLIVDTERGTVVRRESGEVTRTGVLLARPPGVEEPPPAPSARQRERWYGRWRGRFPGLPFPVKLRLSAVGAGRVQGRMSMLLMSETFAGRFHGEMLVFRWRKRHVGFVMERGSDAIVYNDYRGRVFRFQRRG